MLSLPLPLPLPLLTPEAEAVEWKLPVKYSCIPAVKARKPGINQLVMVSRGVGWCVGQQRRFCQEVWSAEAFDHEQRYCQQRHGGQGESLVPPHTR